MYTDENGVLRIPFLRKIGMGMGQTFDCLFDGIEMTLQTCGIEVDNPFARLYA